MLKNNLRGTVGDRCNLPSNCKIFTEFDWKLDLLICKCLNIISYRKVFVFLFSDPFPIFVFH